MRWTKGEWACVRGNDGAFEVVAKGQGYMGGDVVLAARSPHDGRAEEFWANGDLFAAAPDLADALADADWFLNNLSAILPAGWETKVAATDPRPAIRAALKRAGR